jgi:hypothetical protein
VLGIEPRALCRVSIHSTTWLHSSQPLT